MQAKHHGSPGRTVTTAKASSRGPGPPESAVAASAWRQRRVGRSGSANASASAGAGTVSDRVAEVRRWLESICVALLPARSGHRQSGGSSPALECPLTRAPDDTAGREGGRLAGRTNGQRCHESVVRAQRERLRRAKPPGNRRTRKGPVEDRRNSPERGTAFPVRSFWRRNAPDRRRTDRVSRGWKPPACGRRPETGRFDQTARQRQEGQMDREAPSAAWEGKPLKG